MANYTFFPTSIYDFHERLILMKTIETAATRWHFLKLKCSKFDSGAACLLLREREGRGYWRGYGRGEEGREEKEGGGRSLSYQ